jgi:gamma-glutamylcyclotransferase (GGCT)/AIG2-like uncharacterized protein YtfP
MDPDQMARRCPGAQARGATVLNGYRLIFTWDSGFWRGGVGSVVPDPGAQVHGVLWDLDAEHERSLDKYELVHKGVYTREMLTVETEGAPIEALVYVATATDPKKPSKRYVRALVKGARAFGLPAAYVATLEATETR